MCIRDRYYGEDVIKPLNYHLAFKKEVRLVSVSYTHLDVYKRQDREGTQLNYEVLSEAVSAVRCSVPLGTNWKKRIDEDFNSRKDGRK